MRQFEPQQTKEPYCRVVGHPEGCDCGIDPDEEYEKRLESAKD